MLKALYPFMEKLQLRLKEKMTKPPNSDFKHISTPKASDKCLMLHSHILLANNIPFLITGAKPFNLLLCSELGGNINNLSNIIYTIL